VKVLGYRIEANGAPVATADGTEVTVAGLTCATVYSFTARAFDAAGNLSAPSPVANARTRACSTTPPAAPDVPTGLVAAAVTDRRVALTWQPSGDVNDDLAGYAVYRNGVLLGQPIGPGFVARNLAPGSPYSFTVRARDRAGHVTVDSAPLTVST